MIRCCVHACKSVFLAVHVMHDINCSVMRSDIGTSYNFCLPMPCINCNLTVCSLSVAIITERCKAITWQDYHSTCTTHIYNYGVNYYTTTSSCDMLFLLRLLINMNYYQSLCYCTLVLSFWYSYSNNANDSQNK